MNHRATLLALFLAVALPAQDAGAPRPHDVSAAFEQLVAATHWRQRNAARDALARLGAPALATVIDGTSHDDGEVRGACQEILREHFAGDQRANDAIMRGLQDADARISYTCAFHLGSHGVLAATPALQAIVADANAPERTRWAAAKSLGELRSPEIMVMLWQGLGSDDPYTRYLANLGIKGLCGKDLGDFGYEGPWEGAFVSGPAVAAPKGQPIEKASKRVARWQAIVAFGKWLQQEQPKLFKELEEKLW